MAWSLQLGNGELWQRCDNHMLLSKNEKITGERVKMGSLMRQGLKESCGQRQPSRRHRGTAGQHPAQHLRERAGGPTPPKSPQSPTIAALPCRGHPEQQGNASLVRGCNCLTPVNVSMNHKATTALENYSSICCKIGDKANCVSVQSLLFLKESQIQNRVFSGLIHSGLTFNLYLSVISFQHNKNLYCLSENTMNLK